MKNLLFFIPTFLFCAQSISAQELQGADQEPDTAAIREKINNTPYIVEGTITDVEIYAGDREGNRLGEDHIHWKGNEGHYKLDDGSDAIGYGKATIKVHQVLRGNIKTKKIEVVTHSWQLNPSKRNYKGRDTMVYNYTTHTDRSNNDFVFTPRMTGSKFILFCDKTDHNNYKQKDFGFISITTDEKKEYLVKHDMAENKDSIVYSSGNGIFREQVSFYSRSKLNQYMQSFQNIKPLTDAENHKKQKKSAGLKKEDKKAKKSKQKTDSYQDNLDNYNN